MGIQHMRRIRDAMDPEALKGRNSRAGAGARAPSGCADGVHSAKGGSAGPRRPGLRDESKTGESRQGEKGGPADVASIDRPGDQKPAKGF